MTVPIGVVTDIPCTRIVVVAVYTSAVVLYAFAHFTSASESVVIAKPLPMSRPRVFNAIGPIREGAGIHGAFILVIAILIPPAFILSTAAVKTGAGNAVQIARYRRVRPFDAYPITGVPIAVILSALVLVATVFLAPTLHAYATGTDAIRTVLVYATLDERLAFITASHHA